MVIILRDIDNIKIDNIKKYLDIHKILYRERVCSPYKNTKKLLEMLENYADLNRRIVYVILDDTSNTLSGLVACNTKFPVISCPPINSTLQMPREVPVMTILEPENVAASISRMFKF